MEEVVWSHDGRLLALHSPVDLAIYALDPKEGSRLEHVRGFSGSRPLLGFSFRHGEETVAICDGRREIPVRDLRTGFRRGGVKDAGAGVVAVASSPIGPLLAAATDDGKLRLWRDGALDAPPLVLQDHDQGASGLSIDREGKWAVTWTRAGEIRIWDLVTGGLPLKLTTRVETGTGSRALRCAVFAPGGTALWAGGYSDVLRWRLPDGERQPDFPAKAFYLGPGTFHPAGKQCLGQGAKGLAILAFDEGKTVHALEDLPPNALAAFEPTRGKLLAACTQEKLILCDSATGRALHSLALGAPSRAIASSPAGDWLLCGDPGGEQEVLDLRQGFRARKISMKKREDFMEAALDPQGKLLAGLWWSKERRGNLVSVWKAEGSSWKRLPLLDNETGLIRSLAFSPDGRWLALGTQRGSPPLVKVYTVRTGKLAASVKIPVEGGVAHVISDLAFLPKQNLLAVATPVRKGIVVVDLAKAAVAFELRFPPGFKLNSTEIRVNSSGTLLGVPGAEEALVFDLERRTVKRRLAAGKRAIDRLDFSPDGALAVCMTSSYGAVSDLLLFDLRSGSRLCQLPGHSKQTNALRFHPTGKAIISSTMDGSIHIWGAREEKEKQ